MLEELLTKHASSLFLPPMRLFKKDIRVAGYCNPIFAIPGLYCKPGAIAGLLYCQRNLKFSLERTGVFFSNLLLRQ